MICQIIDSVDNHFGEYLWPFLAVRLYSWHNSKEPADCKLIHETVQQLHAELSQTRDVIQWHQAPKPQLFYWGKTSKFYVHRVRFLPIFHGVYSTVKLISG